MQGQSIAKIVCSFVGERPFLRECMKKGLINFSQLARLVISEKKLSKADFDAVLVACRRCFEKLSFGKEFESRIIALFKTSKIEVKTKICVFVVSKKAPFSVISKIVREISEKEELFHIIQGSSAVTIIASQDFFELIKNSLAGFVVSEKSGLVEILVKTSKEIEQIPGSVSFLYGRLSEQGINIVETASSWTDTLFVISEKDLAKTMELLDF
ncbi:MAG: hypothetical protein PHD95_00075 [Candidatus ainarchaeum sp.]|nr:hypothetical protein [Candidatus ainarchaeum sp.]